MLGCLHLPGRKLVVPCLADCLPPSLGHTHSYAFILIHTHSCRTSSDLGGPRWTLSDLVGPRLYSWRSAVPQRRSAVLQWRSAVLRQRSAVLASRCDVMFGDAWKCFEMLQDGTRWYVTLCDASRCFVMLALRCFEMRRDASRCNVMLQDVT
jgi:hypothetical protein